MPSHQETSILHLLARGPTAAGELGRTLDIHQSTLSRALAPLERSGQIVRLFGRTKGARYGLARQVGPAGHTWPVYSIDAAGAPRELGRLQAIAPGHLAVKGPGRLDGLTEGLPHFLQDARPDGFLGHTLAVPLELGLPAQVSDWSDDQALVYLTRFGSDTVGNLIVGAEALDRHLADAGASPTLCGDEREVVYPALARAALPGTAHGALVAGEHPKFSARVTQGPSTQHVLVKFSPSRDSASGVRWADLLIAEAAAAQVLREHGIPAARSEAFVFEDRVFLESERFDRIGAFGRRAVVSLFSIDAWRYGRLDSWSASGARLQADRLLSAQDLRRIILLDTFGSLIANTDRHLGNLSLFDTHNGPFELTPSYDMLPMLFAPVSGQVRERTFNPQGPTAATLSIWGQASELALIYWMRLCADARISEDFRSLCGQCLDAVTRKTTRPIAPAAVSP